MSKQKKDFMTNPTNADKIEQFLKEIQNKNQPDFQGAYKKCYMSNGANGKGQGFVVLKSMATYPAKSFNRRSAIIKELKEKYNINTPYYVTYYQDKREYVEVQERAMGTVLAPFYNHSAKKLILKNGENLKDEDKSSIYPYEISEIGKQVFRYNHNILKIINKAPIEQMVKFATDFKNLINYGVLVDVNHSENFLYDKDNGFAFIDLDLEEVPNRHTIGVTDKDIATEMVCLLSCYIKFLPYMNKNQGEALLKVRNATCDKLLASFKIANFELSKVDYEFLQSYFEGKTEEARKTIGSLLAEYDFKK